LYSPSDITAAGDCSTSMGDRGGGGDLLFLGGGGVFVLFILGGGDLLFLEGGGGFVLFFLGGGDLAFLEGGGVLVLFFLGGGGRLFFGAAGARILKDEEDERFVVLKNAGTDDGQGLFWGGGLHDGRRARVSYMETGRWLSQKCSFCALQSLELFEAADL
jgi:hypothetical protein